VTEHALLDNIKNLENDIHSREEYQMGEPSSSYSNHKSVLTRIHKFEPKIHEKYIQGDSISEQETDVMK
jgi:hypothetical protein